MTRKMMDDTCAQFAGALASKASVPGGGAAAAYVGALGVALGSMAGNFTAGKERYAQVEDDIQRMLADGDAIRMRLLQLVDEDAAAFEPLSRAYSIPKDDPARAETLETCTKAALEAPLEMMREIVKAIELLEEMGEKGSRMLVSDVGCGAALARAALEAAALNVFVNTKSLADRAYAQQIDAECAKMLETHTARAQAVCDGVMVALRA